MVTALDGYEMARRGRAGAALAAAGLGSLLSGCVGTVVIAAFAPMLTKVALMFGPPEYVGLMVLGLVGAVVLAPGSFIKAIGMIVLGLLLGQVNTGTAALFGLIGLVFYKLDCEPAPLALGFILGPMLEENLRRTLLMAGGDWTFVVTRPLSAGLLLAAFALVVLVSLPALRTQREQAFRDD